MIRSIRFCHARTRGRAALQLTARSAFVALTILTGQLVGCGADLDDAGGGEIDAGREDAASDVTHDSHGADGGLDGADGADADDTIDGPTCPDLVEACVADASISCERLFGLPAANTGLPADACAPTCACADDASAWTAPAYDAAFVAGLRAYALIEPPGRMLDDPYALEAPPQERPEAVCAVHLEPDRPGAYRLQTWPDAAAADAEGGVVTHRGACGLCSSLQDLAVYVETPDLATPVRECGLLSFREGPEAQMACLLDIGFSEPCADIWFHNTNHTREVCAEPCLRLLEAPYHDETGAPNECIQCDEDLSGPVFKAVAGRTRRSSGLPTALCRPCNTVAPISHAWLVDAD